MVSPSAVMKCEQKIKQRQSARKRFGLLTIAATGVVAAVGVAGVAGCGGTNAGGSNGVPGLNGGPGTLPFATPAGTRTIFGPENKVLIGSSKLVRVGRGFVSLDPNNRPVFVGLQMFSDAVNDLPIPSSFNNPDAYGINLPPEAVYTIFTFIAIADFSGHLPRGAGDVPHFHPVFVTGTPQTPNPPDFPEEKMPIAAGELPRDHEAIDDVAGGIGQGVQDPAQPQAQLGWDSTGQNYFFYKGHMNAIALGATHAYLRRQERGTEGTGSDVIKQPVVYPKPGLYPHRYTVRWNAKTKSHYFVMEDFRPATNVVP